MITDLVRVEVFVPPGRVRENDRRNLSEPERIRADAMGSPIARARFTATRTRLRRMLGEELRCHPADVPLRTGRTGRPEVVGQALSVSVSHTAGMAVVALSGSTPIGVDVERIERDRLPPEEAWLSPGERQALQHLSESERHRELVRVWTAKEAVAKCLGTGLEAPLKTIEIDRDLGRHPDGGMWQLRPIEAGPRHVATLATPIETPSAPS